MGIDEAKIILREFLAGSFKINDIKDDDDIFETGIVHSLFFIQLLVFIEKKFKIELDAGEFNPDKLKTINVIAGLVIQKTLQ